MLKVFPLWLWVMGCQGGVLVHRMCIGCMVLWDIHGVEVGNWVTWEASCANQNKAWVIRERNSWADRLGRLMAHTGFVWRRCTNSLVVVQRKMLV